MNKINYEKPELNAAEFGKFVQGATFIPGNNDLFGDNAGEGNNGE
jgi:hypothetical protein